MRASLGLEMVCAAHALQALSHGSHLPDALHSAIAICDLPESSRPAVQDMAYVATRQWGLLSALTAKLCARPPEPLTACFLQIAVSQLLSSDALREPAIVVDQAVEAVKLADAAHANHHACFVALRGKAGFVNGVLRGFLRNREALISEVQSASKQALHNYPTWWVEHLVQAWGPQLAAQIMAHTQNPPPFSLRVNRNQTTAQAYLDKLRLSQPGPTTAAAVALDEGGLHTVILPKGLSVETLPNFATGQASVQDLSAQLAAVMLDVRPGHAVLDACSAPGGKTTHLLEFNPAHLVSIDGDKERLIRVHSNLQRYRGDGANKVRVFSEDLTRESSTAGRTKETPFFDRILLDAPCSASGVVRRHPDIRWLRRRGDLATLAKIQRQLLGTLWLRLAPGGKLLYATCSIFPEENDDVVRSFVDKTPDAQWLTLTAPIGGLHLAPGRSPSLRLLPYDGFADLSLIPTPAHPAASVTQLAHDGFYIALLEKRL